MKKGKDKNTIENLINRQHSILKSLGLDDNIELNENLNEIKESIKLSDKISNWIFLGIVCFFATSLFFNLLQLDRNTALDSRIEYLESVDSIYKKIVPLDTTGAISFIEINDKILTYPELIQQWKEGEQKNQKLQTEKLEYEMKFNDYKWKLDWILKTYDIKIIEKNNYFQLISPEIDSALLLLPLYRDKIQYIENEKVWQVTR